MKMYKARVRHDENYSEIVYREYNVIGETAKCYYVADNHWNPFTKTYYTKRRVSKEGKNCFAFTTKELALKNLYYRQKYFAGILRHKLKIAGLAKDKIRTMIDSGELNGTFSHYTQEDIMW